VEKIQGVVAFLIGFVIVLAGFGGTFMYNEWASLVPSWDLVKGEDIFIITLLAALGGLVSLIIGVMVVD
jgi:hypothetical protein